MPADLIRPADKRLEHRRQVRLAAERVARLSKPGTPERLFTLIDVSEDTGITKDEIVTWLVGRRNPK